MQRRRSVGSRASLGAMAVCAIALVATPLERAHAVQTPSGTLDRIRAAGKIKLGYRADARPFSYRDDSGQPAGYSVALCQRIVEALKSEPGLGSVAAEWVPVTVEDRFRALQQGQIDLLCGADTVTLARRAEVSFSIPTFPGGIGALVRADAPARLREVLSGRGQTYHPVWRASATQALQSRAFSAIAGTTSEKWLTERLRDLQVITSISPVNSYETGIQALLDHRSDALFGERAVLLDAARRHASARDLTMVDRFFTFEPLALAFGRGNEDFRLLVDRTLSHLYGSGDLGGAFTKWFGEPTETTLNFFRWNTLPD